MSFSKRDVSFSIWIQSNRLWKYGFCGRFHGWLQSFTFSLSTRTFERCFPNWCCKISRRADQIKLCALIWLICWCERSNRRTAKRKLKRIGQTMKSFRRHLFSFWPDSTQQCQFCKHIYSRIKYKTSAFTSINTISIYFYSQVGTDCRYIRAGATSRHSKSAYRRSRRARK